MIHRLVFYLVLNVDAGKTGHFTVKYFWNPQKVPCLNLKAHQIPSTSWKCLKISEWPTSFTRHNPPCYCSKSWISDFLFTLVFWIVPSKSYHLHLPLQLSKVTTSSNHCITHTWKDLLTLCIWTWSFQYHHILPMRNIPCLALCCKFCLTGHSPRCYILLCVVGILKKLHEGDVVILHTHS